MTVGTFLKQASSTLQNAGIETARLDILILLEDTLGKNRASILAHLDDEIDGSTEVELNTKIAQRARHIPLAYIRHKAIFYGREFLVSDSVLVPRPESETIITLLKTLDLPAKPLIADVGCGSGCIGITASLELPEAEVFLYDIDDDALKIAQQNALIHNISPQISKQDLLTDNSPHLDVVLANLPYVPETLELNRAASYEPRLALFSGQDGLDLYRRFWKQLGTTRPSHVLTESLEIQHQAMQALAGNAGFRLVATDGLIQHFTSSL